MMQLLCEGGYQSEEHTYTICIGPRNLKGDSCSAEQKRSQLTVRHPDS